MPSRLVGCGAPLRARGCGARGAPRCAALARTHQATRGAHTPGHERRLRGLEQLGTRRGGRRRGRLVRGRRQLGSLRQSVSDSRRGASGVGQARGSGSGRGTAASPRPAARPPASTTPPLTDGRGRGRGRGRASRATTSLKWFCITSRSACAMTRGGVSVGLQGRERFRHEALFRHDGHEGSRPLRQWHGTQRLTCLCVV